MCTPISEKFKTIVLPNAEWTASRKERKETRKEFLKFKRVSGEMKGFIRKAGPHPCICLCALKNSLHRDEDGSSLPYFYSMILSTLVRKE